MKDFYYILGTERNCTSSDLNAAYRKLAQKLQAEDQEHDHFLNSHFEEITEAYQILSNPTRRRKYDIAFKKHYQRRLYYFKIKHLNILAALTFIMFTALFGLYVMKAINGDKIKKPVKIETASVIKPKRHKKKHIVKVPVKPVTQNNLSPAVATIKPAKTPVADTPHRPIPSLQPVKIEKVPLAMHVDPPVAVVNNTAYVRANITGLVNLHELASYRSAVVTTIPNHAKISVLEKGSSFYKIEFNGQTGYVPRWTIADTEN